MSLRPRSLLGLPYELDPTTATSVTSSANSPCIASISASLGLPPRPPVPQRTQQFRHALVGDLILSYEALQLTADIGLMLIAHIAQPDSPSQEALNRLATAR
jgi:MmyB-like transcription regulator ligand binding domain